MPVKCISPERAAELSDVVGRALDDLDPHSLGIIKESMDSLPQRAKIQFAEALPGLEKRGRLADLALKIRTLRSASMLSGPGTHIRNTLGTSLHALFQPAKTLTAALVDLPVSATLKARNLLTGKTGPVRSRYFSEAAAEAYGWFRAIPEALAQAGRESRAVREGLEAAAGAADPAFAGVAGKIIESPLRALNLVDRVFYSAAFNSNIYKMASRQALKEGTPISKVGTRIAQIIDEQADMVTSIGRLRERGNQAARLARQSFKAMTPEQIGDWKAAAADLLKVSGGRSASKLKKMLRSLSAGSEKAAKAVEAKTFVHQAAQNADRVVFTAREGELIDRVLDGLEEGVSKSPLGQMVLNAAMPFRRTPANIARETLRSSLIGVPGAVGRAIRGSKAGLPDVRSRLMDDLGQAFLGTAAMYTMLRLIDADVIKVNPFRRRAPAERTTEEAAGILPDTMQIGDWSVPISRMEPIGAFILTAGRVVDGARRGEVPEGDIAQILEATKLLATQSVNEDFADPLANFLEAVTARDKSLEQFMQDLGGSFVPRAFTTFEQRVKERPAQPGTGIAQNFAQGFVRALPGQGETALGLFGKERETQAPVLSTFLGRTGKLGNDPTAQEMLRVGALHMAPNGLSADFKKKLEQRGINFSDQEDRVMRTAKGQVQEFAVRAVLSSQLYQSLPQTPEGDQLRKRLIDKAYNDASRKVDQRVKALKLARVPLTERVIFGS